MTFFIVEEGTGLGSCNIIEIDICAYALDLMRTARF